MNFTIITFYKFVALNDLENLKENIVNFCNKLEIKGTILLAIEGVNATIAGEEKSIAKFKEFIYNVCIEFEDLHFKTSFADLNPFQKMKVRLKKEIVKIGLPALQIDAEENYVSASEWDFLINDENTILIDTRNRYETKFGKFANAIVPEIDNFHEFPVWFQDFIKRKKDMKKKKIAMYCTGGIRCEKSVSYVKSLGFKNVFHLKDGILGYLAQNDNKQMWQNECFVFDDRVAVTKNVDPTQNLRCHLCSAPAGCNDQLVNVTKGKVVCHVCKH